MEGERRRAEDPQRQPTASARTIEISLPGPAIPWNCGRSPSRICCRRRRQLKLVPYLEWVLNRPDADRGHTQYNRLFAEMEYVQPCMPCWPGTSTPRPWASWPPTSPPKGS